MNRADRNMVVKLLRDLDSHSISLRDAVKIVFDLEESSND